MGMQIRRTICSQSGSFQFCRNQTGSRSDRTHRCVHHIKLEKSTQSAQGNNHNGTVIAGRSNKLAERFEETTEWNLQLKLQCNIHNAQCTGKHLQKWQKIAAYHQNLESDYRYSNNAWVLYRLRLPGYASKAGVLKMVHNVSIIF